MKGVVRDSILQTADYTHVARNGQEKVDCAYLVTIGDSPHIPTQLARMSRCANHVVVLHTVPCLAATDARFQGVEFVLFRADLHHQLMNRPSSKNPTRRWNQRFDLPSKRMYALEHATRAGYSIILLIDDDIIFRQSLIPSAIHVLCNGTDIACTYSLIHADVSTLDRVYSAMTGTPPHVSISGNAVILKISPRLGIFPYIYNEDWLFFWSSIKHGGAVVTPLQTVVQRAPRKERVALVPMEQFGELIVSMLFHHKNSHADLSMLQDADFVAGCMEEYRDWVQGLLQCPGHEHTVEAALAALADVSSDDVRTFAARFESEVLEHYEHQRAM
ncbi:MAG: hypothetical protein IPM18_17250 [Phycisphaerales bacterium]|nr:hypothetical protein [Phycisphaerales bacterium]